MQLTARVDMVMVSVRLEVMLSWPKDVVMREEKGWVMSMVIGTK